MFRVVIDAPSISPRRVPRAPCTRSETDHRSRGIVRARAFGTFDFKIDPQEYQGVAIPTLIQEGLGLKVEPRKFELQVMVIDWSDVNVFCKEYVFVPAV